jgi:hypothetical protein
MAAALRPPSQARLEFLGPIGGPRLVLATDGQRATAVRPQERQFDITPGTPGAMKRLLGLPLDGERLIALLSGAPLCRAPGPSGDEALGTPARRGPPEPVACPAGDVVVTDALGEGDEALRGAILRDAGTGAIIAEVEYGDRLPVPGGRWPRDIRVSLPTAEVTISLKALDGPAKARLPDELFAPSVPEGFVQRPLFGQAEDPALYGTGDPWGR